AGTDGTVRLWDAVPPRGATRRVAGKMLHRFDPRAGGIESLAAAGSTLAAGASNGTVFLWDLASNKELGRFAQEGSVFCLAAAALAQRRPRRRLQPRRQARRLRRRRRLPPHLGPRRR